METEWRDIFVQKPIHEVREIVYDTRAKATAKKLELQTAVKYLLLILVKLTCRHSHRDLLKTAYTVLDMREVLESLEAQYGKLMTYSPEIIERQAVNAEHFQRHASRLSPLKDRAYLRRRRLVHFIGNWVC